MQLNRLHNVKLHVFGFTLHGAIYRPDSFGLMLHYCANLKAISYDSTSFNRIVADKSHHVIVAFKSSGERTYNSDNETIYRPKFA